MVIQLSMLCYCLGVGWYKDQSFSGAWNRMSLAPEGSVWLPSLSPNWCLVYLTNGNLCVIEQGSAGSLRGTCSVVGYCRQGKKNGKEK